MISRREAIQVLGAVCAGAWTRPTQDPAVPSLAPGTPMSPERRALIDGFQAKAVGVDKSFEAREHRSDWVMPYRLFRPKAVGPLPLVLYLHGSGGLGTDNEKQLGLGNVFGTRVWALPDHQARFPCYVLAPQTDRGWARYEATSGGGAAQVVPGFGDGARLAVEIIDTLRREFAVDERRIYVTGQSMGGAGVWNLTAHRPRYFAAAVSCCGSATKDAAALSAPTPLWNFHGDADETVPLAVSRDRIASLTKAGARPLSTEYAGVGHNVWEWAYTEPALLTWVFTQTRRSA